METPVGKAIKQQIKYIDLYPGITDEAYNRFFKYVADIGSVEGAQRGTKRIKQIHDYFETIGDRAGQHNSIVVALAAYHRAYHIGKRDVALVYSGFIATMLMPNTLARLGLNKETTPKRLHDSEMVATLQKFNTLIMQLEDNLKSLAALGDMPTWLALLCTAQEMGLIPMGAAAQLIFELGRRAGESNFDKGWQND